MQLICWPDKWSMRGAEPLLSILQSGIWMGQLPLHQLVCNYAYLLPLSTSCLHDLRQMQSCVCISW